MADEILVTKLHIPQGHWANHVPRPELIERMESKPGHKLTLISAPPGFGKTTLVSEWIVHTHHPCAWLSLDESDDELVRFWSYLIAALQTAAPNIGRRAASILGSSPDSNIEPALKYILNDLAAHPESIALVLDDYHLIFNSAIHASLAYFIEHLPAKLRCLIATRADPPFPLPRWRARGELLEIRAANLRFTQDEARAFLEQELQISLAQEDLALLERRTEGWVAALQFVALSLQGRSDVSEFVRTIAGDDRYVIDYLAEEVFERQPPHIQEFLLRTSILARLSGPLCDAVVYGQTGREHQGDQSQTLIATLERRNLFVVPLDNARHWYRYHHLFAEFLRRRLRQTEPELITQLHLRASKWFEQNDHIQAAVSHALAVEDYERTGALIEGNMRFFMTSGKVHLSTLRSWIETLPAELIQTREQLGLIHAWTLVWSGEPDAASRALRAVEGRRELEAEVEGDDPRSDSGEINALRANIAYARGNFSETILASERALNQLPREDPFLWSLSALLQGHAHFVNGDPLAAKKSLAQVTALAQKKDILTTALIAQGRMIQVHSLRGRLNQAIDAFNQAMALASDHQAVWLPALGVAYIGAGDVLRERNELHIATTHLRKGLELCEGWGGLADFTFEGTLTFARVFAASGQHAKAQQTLVEARRLGESFSLRHWKARLEALRARIDLARGKLESALRWAAELEAGSISIKTETPKPPLVKEFEQLTIARVRLAAGDAPEAATLLSAIVDAAEQAGREGSALEALTLQALAIQAKGDQVGAVEALTHVLRRAKLEGYFHLFAEQGPPIRDLLRKAAERGLETDYIARLLVALEVPQVPEPPPGVEPLVEPLTERELEVLRLIAIGMTDQEIADQLVIALSTAKKHAQNIYGKLDVNNRAQATARGRELGLLR